MEIPMVWEEEGGGGIGMGRRREKVEAGTTANYDKSLFYISDAWSHNWSYCVVKNCIDV
jgi:hypothetical protein